MRGKVRHGRKAWAGGKSGDEEERRRIKEDEADGDGQVEIRATFEDAALKADITTSAMRRSTASKVPTLVRRMEPGREGAREIHQKQRAAQTCETHEEGTQSASEHHAERESEEKEACANIDDALDTKCGKQMRSTRFFWKIGDKQTEGGISVDNEPEDVVVAKLIQELPAEPIFEITTWFQC